MNRSKKLIVFSTVVLALCLYLYGCSGGNSNFHIKQSFTGPNCTMFEDQYRVAIVATGDELAELDKICSQSLSILQSDEFRSNLLSLKNKQDKIVRSASVRGVDYLSYQELADVVALKNEALHKFRSHFVLHGTYFETGKVFTGVCQNSGQRRDCNTYQFEENRNNDFVATRIVTLGEDSVLESVIGRKIHERWRSKSDERKSCAINTFTHELMHAFSNIPTTGFHENYFVDTIDLNAPVQARGYPLATYLAGTVAQCTWLQNEGAIKRSDEALRSCVTKFGLNQFNSDACV